MTSDDALSARIVGRLAPAFGFARALVVHPNILLMDEPLSELDVLTSATLRTDFLNLRSEGQLPIKGL